MNSDDKNALLFRLVLDGSVRPETAAKAIRNGGPVLIGLTGYARSGKDTVGKILVEKHGFERRSFAEPIRRGLLALDPTLCSDEDGEPYHLSQWLAVYRGDWDGVKSSAFGPEVRRLLQRFGTEAGRDIHGPDVWVNALFREPLAAKTVITDVRFLNEAQAIARRGGMVVRVYRPGYAALNQHASENELDQIRAFWSLGNAGSVACLENHVDSMVKDLQMMRPDA